VTYEDISRWRRREKRRRLFRRIVRALFMVLAGAGLALFAWIVLALILTVL
jgi:hypothetical protein